MFLKNISIMLIIFTFVSCDSANQSTTKTAEEPTLCVDLDPDKFGESIKVNFENDDLSEAIALPAKSTAESIANVPRYFNSPVASDEGSQFESPVGIIAYPYSIQKGEGQNQVTLCVETSTKYKNSKRNRIALTALADSTFAKALESSDKSKSSNFLLDTSEGSAPRIVLMGPLEISLFKEQSLITYSSANSEAVRMGLVVKIASVSSGLFGSSYCQVSLGDSKDPLQLPEITNFYSQEACDLAGSAFLSSSILTIENLGAGIIPAAEAEEGRIISLVNVIPSEVVVDATAEKPLADADADADAAAAAKALADAAAAKALADAAAAKAKALADAAAKALADDGK